MSLDSRGRSTKQTDALARAASTALSMRRSALRDAFCADDLRSRPTEAQLEILKAAKDVLVRIVRAGNQSGKTGTGARDASWIMNREHPYLDVVGTWGSGPLLGIVSGVDRTQIEQNLWERGIKPLLTDPTMWKEHRPSGTLASATHRQTGDTIIFISHNHASPDDVKHMQSYAAHWVWVDEMPKSPAVFEELTRRTDAKRGRLLATFTQKVRNDKVRRAIDGLNASISRLFRLNKLDNPLYADRKQEEMDKISHLSPAEQAAILNGDWLESSSKIYSIDYDRVVRAPLGYQPLWAHHLVVDPATESKLGLLLWTQDPDSLFWYNIMADYIEGLYVPTRIIEAVEAKVKGVNVVKRTFDTAAAWYAHQAREMGYSYSPVPEKAGAKDGWIAHCQEQLGKTYFVAPWCIKLVDELESMERSETSPDKIANPHRFHLVDCLHYFSCTKPRVERPKVYNHWHEWVHDGNNERREKAALKKAKTEAQKKRTRIQIRGGRAGGFRSWR